MSDTVHKDPFGNTLSLTDYVVASTPDGLVTAKIVSFTRSRVKVEVRYGGKFLIKASGLYKVGGKVCPF